MAKGKRRPSVRERRPDKMAMNPLEVGEVRSQGRGGVCDSVREKRREEGGGWQVGRGLGFEGEGGEYLYV